MASGRAMGWVSFRNAHGLRRAYHPKKWAEILAEEEETVVNIVPSRRVESKNQHLAMQRKESEFQVRL